MAKDIWEVGCWSALALALATLALALALALARPNLESLEAPPDQLGRRPGLGR